MDNRRPVNARRLFIDAVLDEMKSLDKEYDHEAAKGLMPFINIASTMAQEDLDSLKKRQNRVAKPTREAAE